jgi:hypothetical protein
MNFPRHELSGSDAGLARFGELFPGETRPLEVPEVIEAGLRGPGVTPAVDYSRCLQGACCLFHAAEGGSCSQPRGTSGRLLEYAEESDGPEEPGLRMAALGQQHCNSVGSHPSPEEFVEAARVLRAFLGGVTEAAVLWPVLDGGPGLWRARRKVSTVTSL